MDTNNVRKLTVRNWKTIALGTFSIPKGHKLIATKDGWVKVNTIIT